MSSKKDAKDLRKLQKLELVNRITQEMANHTQINDSTMAEYIISLHKVAYIFYLSI